MASTRLDAVTCVNLPSILAVTLPDRAVTNLDGGFVSRVNYCGKETREVINYTQTPARL